MQSLKVLFIFFGVSFFFVECDSRVGLQENRMQDVYG